MHPQIEIILYTILTIFVLIYITKLLQEQGGMFTADHLSPTQLNKNIDQWFYDYCKLTAAERKKLKPNMKMIFGGLVGQAMQDMIVHNLTLEQVLKGKK
jgi:hypothetical protein